MLAELVFTGKTHTRYGDKKLVEGDTIEVHKSAVDKLVKSRLFKKTAKKKQTKQES